MYYVLYNCIKPAFSYLQLSDSETIFEAILLDHHPFPIVTNYSIPSIFNNFFSIRVFKTHAIDECIRTIHKSIFNNYSTWILTAKFWNICSLSLKKKQKQKTPLNISFKWHLKNKYSQENTNSHMFWQETSIYNILNISRRQHSLLRAATDSSDLQSCCSHE